MAMETPCQTPDAMYHVNSGIWPAFMLAITLSFIVSLGARSSK